MPEQQPQNRRRPWPLVATLILAACLTAVFFYLGHERPPEKSDLDNAATEREEQLVLLRKQKAVLEDLVRQDPCTIRHSLAPGTAQPPPATQASPLPAKQRPPDPPPTTQNQEPQPPPAPKQPPQAAHPSTPFSKKEVKDATVLVLCKTRDGLSTGTGFFVAHDAIMTNYHVIGDTPERIYVINSKLGRLIRANFAGALKEPEKGGRDYALLHVAAQNTIKPFPIRTNLQQADTINAWGYPAAVSRSDPKYQALLRGKTTSAPEVIFSNGVVSAILDRNPKVIAHTAPLSPGNSGGPLTDEQGQLVGINTMISLDEDSYRQTSIALPASDFINFLQKNGVAVVHGEE